MAYTYRLFRYVCALLVRVYLFEIFDDIAYMRSHKVGRLVDEVIHGNDDGAEMFYIVVLLIHFICNICIIFGLTPLRFNEQ